MSGMTRRQVIVWALIGVLLGAMLGLATFASPAQAAGWRRETCRYQTLEHHRWTRREVKATIRCAVAHWSVPGGYPKARYIAWRESRFHWHSVNRESGACGIYQHLPRYWKSREDAYDGRLAPLGESCFNARTNVIVTIRMVHAGGWGPWS